MASTLQETIQRLRRMTTANGATEHEQQAAELAIQRLLRRAKERNEDIDMNLDPNTDLDDPLLDRTSKFVYVLLDEDNSDEHSWLIHLLSGGLLQPINHFRKYHISSRGKIRGKVYALYVFGRKNVVEKVSEDYRMWKQVIDSSFNRVPSEQMKRGTWTSTRRRSFFHGYISVLRTLLENVSTLVSAEMLKEVDDACVEYFGKKLKTCSSSSDKFDVGAYQQGREAAQDKRALPGGR